MVHLEFWALDVQQNQEWSFSWQQDLQDPNKLFPVPPGKTPASSEVYDFASLTKVLFTGALLVRLAESMNVSLDYWNTACLKDKIPELKSSPLGEISISELWEHRSSLKANCVLDLTDRSFFSLKERDLFQSYFLKKLLDENFFEEDKSTRYSDVGFLLLGIYLERSKNQNLFEQWQELQQFLGLTQKRIGFALDNKCFSQALPTEVRREPGLVNDDKAYVMGGVAPHAGLFGDSSSIKSWLLAVYDWSQQSTQAQQWLSENRSQVSDRFFWGWDTASGALDSHAGASAPKNTRGHLGYTGTALWFDPILRRYGVLLSNRVYPSHTLNSQKSIQRLRTDCFEKLWQGKLDAGWEI